MDKQTKIIKNYTELYTRETLETSSIFNGLKVKLKDLASHLHKWQELNQELDKLIDKYEAKIENNKYSYLATNVRDAIDASVENTCYREFMEDLKR